MNIPQSLIALGLDEQQARLYTHLLKQPKNAELTVFSIARGIDMPRSTVYVTLQELESKRLISSFKKNNILRYIVGDPSRLKRDLEEKQEILTSVLPLLQGLSKESPFSPSVQTFSGAKGVITVFDDIYSNPKENGVREYHTFSHPKLIQYMPKKFSKYMETKKKLNIQSKILVPSFVAKKSPKEYQNDSHRETRFLPEPIYFEGTIIIYGRKTAIFSHRDNEVYSMIIDSPAITEMLDGIFMSLWELVPKTK